MKLIIFIALAVFSQIIFIGSVKAGDPHHSHDTVDGVDGIDGVAGVSGLNAQETRNYLDTENYWTYDEISGMFAASTALSGLDFDSTTIKTQFGLSLGGYGNQQDVAFGVAQVWDVGAWDDGSEAGNVLFSFKTTLQESGPKDKRPWVGAVIWKKDLR